MKNDLQTLMENSKAKNQKLIDGELYLYAGTLYQIVSSDDCNKEKILADLNQNRNILNKIDKKNMAINLAYDVRRNKIKGVYPDDILHLADEKNILRYLDDNLKIEQSLSESNNVTCMLGDEYIHICDEDDFISLTPSEAKKLVHFINKFIS